MSEDIFGCLLLGWFFLAGALPMLFLKMIAPLPITIDPATYLVWCVVQDFVFFALIFRNLEDWINPLYAGATTALVFGLSHYPYLLFIVVTTLSGAVWAYAFFRTRSLSLIVLSHWVMGVVYLS